MTAQNAALWKSVMYVALLRTILKPGELAWAAASACLTPSEYAGGAYSHFIN